MDYEKENSINHIKNTRQIIQSRISRCKYQPIKIHAGKRFYAMLLHECKQYQTTNDASIYKEDMPMFLDGIEVIEDENIETWKFKVVTTGE